MRDPLKDSTYKRVQPGGLISISSKWVILHNENYQILVQIKINPAGIVLYEKIFFLNRFSPKRQYFVEI